MGGVRLYGRFADWSSQAMVARGFQEALESAGLLDGTVELDCQTDMDSDAPPGASAPIGVYVGPPNGVYQLTCNAAHKRRYAMLVPNSDVVPAEMVRAYQEHCDVVLAPSDWAATILRNYFDCEVANVPHGLDSEFLTSTEEDVAPDGDVFYHFSTSDRQRKGTIELVQAWTQLADQTRGFELRLVLDPHVQAALMTRLAVMGMIPRNITFGVRGLGDERGLGPVAMRTLLRTSAGVVQPSRGEGFGLVPLEARACGTIAIATYCTGHSEHMPTCDQRGVCRVPHGPAEPIDDLPGAMAPGLSVDDLRDTLAWTIENIDELRRHARRAAPEVQRQWSWRAQLEPFINRIKEEIGNHD